MIRQTLFAGFSYLAGLTAAYNIAVGNNYALVILSICIAVLITAVNKKYIKYIILCTMFFNIGVCYEGYYTQNTYNELLKYDGTSQAIKGYVYDVTDTEYGNKILTVKGRIHGIKTTVAFMVKNDNYNYYDEITIAGKLHKITDSINFPAENYYKSKGIFLQGEFTKAVVHKGKNVNPVFREIKNFRDYIFKKITADGTKESAFLGAMLCGDKSELSQNSKSLLYRTGIGHIFAVSGTHMVIITSISGFILQMFLSKRKSIPILLAVIWAFALFAGFSPSIVRAAIMMTLTKAAPLFYREPDVPTSLALAGMVLTFNDPYIIADPSFLMSFSSTFAISVVSPKICKSIYLKEKFGNLKRSLIVSTVIMFFTLPFSAVFFNGISVISPIANIFLLPICSLALIIVFIFSLFGGISPVNFLLTISELLIKLVFIIANALSKITNSYISTGSLFVKTVIILTCLIMIVVSFKIKDLKTFSICSIIIIISWISVSNFYILFKSDTVKMYIIPNNKSSQILVIKGIDSFIIDINSYGKYNNGIQRIIDKEDVKNINFAIVNSKNTKTVSNMKYDFIPDPKKYITFEKSNALPQNTILVDKNNNINFKNMDIIINDNKDYTIMYDDFYCRIMGSKILLNGDIYDLSSEKSICEIAYDKNSIRRNFK